MTNIVYLRMKKKIIAKPNSKILLKDIAFLATNEQAKKDMEMIQLYHVSKKDNEFVVIDSFIIIEYLNKKFPYVEFQLLGVTETIVQVKNNKHKPSIFLISFVWIVLFIGTAMAIMNFHYDTSMQEVQQRIHYLFTGEQVNNPFWIQIPYSLGLGVGMILFLNHWFHRRLNEEPSPLEVEIFNYQKSLDDYVMYFENELNDEDKHL